MEGERGKERERETPMPIQGLNNCPLLAFNSFDQM